MGKLSFETFVKQWEWPGTPTDSPQMLLYLWECEKLLKTEPENYLYLSAQPCPPGRERSNYLFRAIFYFDIEQGPLSVTAAFDGKISEKPISPGTIAVGGIGNWCSRNSSSKCRSLSIIFMREMIRLVSSGKSQVFYCHYPPAGGILASLVENARLIAEDISAPRNRRMSALLTAICEQLKLDIKRISPEEQRQYPVIVEKAIHYIHLNFQHPINCSTVSEALNVNRTMLSGEFHRATGTTLKDFILDLRLDKAQWLLEAGTLKVKEIATQCGFSDTGYFIRIFRKKFGISPAKYREQLFSGTGS